ncbi:MAG: DUF883 domain-containing protein [Betaproteobacteria bacterium]|nr:DUF883 domain-containing protein [Betaproteobacteria bacterium]
MNTDIAKEKLTSDMKVLIADLEDLLRATAGQVGEKAVVARERIEASLANAKLRLADAERALADTTRQAVRVTDAYVHDHPWAAVGIGTALGLVLGMLISRR